MTANERVRELLKAHGINPAPDLENNAKALCGLFTTMKYGEANVPEGAMTIAGAIRQITDGNAIRIIGIKDEDGNTTWEISAIEEMDPSRVGEEDEAPRITGLGIRGAVSENEELANTINDVHFVKAFNAIARHLRGESIEMEPADDDVDEEAPNA